MNSNATRFTQLFSLDFDQSGQIASASLQVRKTFLFFSFRHLPLVLRAMNFSLSSQGAAAGKVEDRPAS